MKYVDSKTAYIFGMNKEIYSDVKNPKQIFSFNNISKVTHWLVLYVYE